MTSDESSALQRTIVFVVRHVDSDKLPFSSRERYFYSYQEYLLAMKRAGGVVYFSTNDEYEGDGRFRRGWTVDAVSAVSEFQEVANIQADLVFDKGSFKGRDVRIVTDPSLHEILDDKVTTYRLFHRFQPQTYICNTSEELTQKIADMPGDMVVVKNPKGSCGKQVYIGRKGEIQIPDNETYPLIVQEFVDMSEGVPGLVSGPHDVRILLAGGVIIGANMRWPAEGELRANVAQGGGQRLLGEEEIPEELRIIALQVDAELPDVPRYYSIDFAKGTQGWRMIELNNKPGLFPEKTGPLARVYMDALAKYLVEV